MTLFGLNKIPQVRIAVNNRCQKACFYCRPSGEGSAQLPESEMSSDDIVRVVEHLAHHGISEIKLTGGDPILKADIVELVSRIKRVSGVRTVHLVTRHYRAGDLAADLSDAGLDCLNFSLDSLDPATFKAITGVGGHQKLIDAIRKSVPVSKSVKINVVIMKGINDAEWLNMVRFSEEVGAQTLKFLDLILDMNPDGSGSFLHRLSEVAPGRTFSDLYFPLDEISEYLSAVAVFSNVSKQPGGLGHPMMAYTLDSGLIVELKDARRGAWYGNVCVGCPLYPCHDAIMALRLTTDGKLQRCLAREDNLLDLITHIRSGDVETAQNLIASALDTFAMAEFDGKPQTKAQALY